MTTSPSTDRLISTGTLPSPTTVADAVADAHRRFASVDDGENSAVYPLLAEADRGAFGVSLVGVDGAPAAAGHHDVEFALMSVAKPFTYALVCDALGPIAAGDRVGVNATGLPFNSIEAIERGEGARTNAMVNSGAIVTAGLIAGDTPEARWATLLQGLSAFAGRPLTLDTDLYECALATNYRNRAITHLLHSLRALPGTPDETLDIYVRQSCLAVTADDLAVMGATLADGGVNPRTGVQVVSAEACRYTLAQMVTAGMYETSGAWLYRVGLPAKSGIGGGIVTVSPGKGGLGTFSPPLDAAGNSVRGQLAAEHLSKRLGLDLLSSQPSS
jgi:glutaminase